MHKVWINTEKIVQHNYIYTHTEISTYCLEARRNCYRVK